MKRNFAALLAASVLTVSPLAVLAQAGPSGHDSVGLTELIDQTRQDIAAGEAAGAFDRLTLLETRYAGQPTYDYWLGVAAARSGQWFESSMALERAVAVNPGHAGARLELVGVYLQQGQLDRAELQLQTLQQLVDGGNAPANAREAVERYQAMLTARQQGVEPRTRVVMLGLDVGYDSNYLNYPDSFDIFANTVFEGMAIFAADATSYTGLRANYWQQFELSGPDFVEVMVSANSRINADSAASDFNTHMLSGTVNYGKTRDSGGFFKLGVELGTVLLDNSYYRAHSGMALSVMEPVGRSGQWHGRAYMRSFKFESSRFNFNSYGVDNRYLHQHNLRWSTQLQLLVEREDTVKQPTRQGGGMWRGHAGVRANYQVRSGHQLSAEVQYQGRRYQQDGFAVFNLGEARKRSDDAMLYRFEWNGRLSERWRANAFAQYREQSSNIDFFELDQVLVQGGMTYVF